MDLHLKQIYFGSGSRKKFQIQPDPDAQHCFILNKSRWRPRGGTEPDGPLRDHCTGWHYAGPGHCQGGLGVQHGQLLNYIYSQKAFFIFVSQFMSDGHTEKYRMSLLKNKKGLHPFYPFYMAQKYSI